VLKGQDGWNPTAPFQMPQVKKPVIPSNQVELTDFGAIGDGICTLKIA